MFIMLDMFADDIIDNTAVGMNLIRRDNKLVPVLDTEDGVIESVRYSLAVRHCSNLEDIDTTLGGLCAVKQPFICDKLGLAYMPSSIIGGKLWHKGYVYDIHLGLLSFTLDGNTFMVMRRKIGWVNSIELYRFKLCSGVVETDRKSVRDFIGCLGEMGLNTFKRCCAMGE